MPSRDPSADDPSSEPRWASEGAREPGRRALERRHRPAEPTEGGQDGTASWPMHAAGPAGPGHSHGGNAGRTSGSQVHGDDTGAAWPDDGPFGQRSPAPPIDRRRPADGDRAAAADRNPPWPKNMRSPRQPPPGAERPDDTQFDADYRQWRDEQMRLLDLDYAQWRKERYRKFAEEFSQWRSQRLKASTPAQSKPEDAPGFLGDVSPLGMPAPPAPRAQERERAHEPDRQRPGGSLLGSLLGGHSERHKAQP